MVTIECYGTSYPIEPGQSFTIGREADLVLDSGNPFLHRTFLTIENRSGLWWLNNVGSHLSATVSARSSGMEAWLSPGGCLPLVFPAVFVCATAGDMTYDFQVFCDDAPFQSIAFEATSDDDGVTIGSVSLTNDQRLLIVALSENVLRNFDRGAGSVPTSMAAADRLGWAITKFNRKLDNVCSKLEQLGVAGLHGGPTRLAVSRKARLVEYAVGAGIVTRADLALLPAETQPAPSDSDDQLWPGMDVTPWLRVG